MGMVLELGLFIQNAMSENRKFSLFTEIKRYSLWQMTLSLSLSLSLAN